MALNECPSNRQGILNLSVGLLRNLIFSFSTGFEPVYIVCFNPLKLTLKCKNVTAT